MGGLHLITVKPLLHLEWSRDTHMQTERSRKYTSWHSEYENYRIKVAITVVNNL